ncbi:hypothetical protein D3C72_2329670 [compost metagenome]
MTSPQARLMSSQSFRITLAMALWPGKRKAILPRMRLGTTSSLLLQLACRHCRVRACTISKNPAVMAARPPKACSRGMPGAACITLAAIIPGQ